MKRIPLSQGKFALVDDEDYDFLSQWKWLYHPAGYAIQSGGSRSYMHRLILKRMGMTPKKYLRVKGSLDYRRNILIPAIVCPGESAKIPLTKGRVALVDGVDYAYLMQWRWCDTNGYAVRKGSDGQDIKMHRVIMECMGTRKFLEVDHANMKTLDNRRANLRPATKSDQSCNRGPSIANKSGYKGVFFHKGCGKWWAYINKDGKRHHLGFFGDKIEAARAYNKAALKLHGEFARLNEVD